ncbi:MAG: hypothetical protein GY711_08980 [bacterium]|nr:hypothetical protein [bacterium]
MMALLEHRTSTYALEIAAWALPAVLGALLFARSQEGARATWLVVALMTAAFALDKAVDLHSVLRSAGQAVVMWIDPETRFRGKNAIFRVLLLGGIFSGGVLALWCFLRADRLTASKLTSVVGLVVVMAYLGLRLMPRASQTLESTGAGWAIEAGAWALVVAGELAAWRAAR